MISSVRSSAQSSSLSSASSADKKKLSKTKVDELMRSIRDDLELHSKLSKFYYTKIGEKNGMTIGEATMNAGKNKSDIKKFERIANKDSQKFSFDPVSNKFKFKGTITLDEELLKNHKKYASLRIDNVSAIIRNSSSKSAQMNSGDKLTDAGLSFITAALFADETAIKDEEVLQYLANSGFSQEVSEIGLKRWYDLKNAISANLYTDWTQIDNTGALSQMLNGVMTSTFLQGLIHLYKNIRLQKLSNGKYSIDSVFALLGDSFNAVDAKRQEKLRGIMSSVGGSEEALGKLFQYGEEYNRPQLTESQYNEIARQSNKTKQKDLQTRYKKSIRDAILRSVRSEFGAYAGLDDKKLGSFLKSLDNYPQQGQFNNNTLLSISRSMVDSKATNPALKPVTGEEHVQRKELLKNAVNAVSDAVKQTGSGGDEVLQRATDLIVNGQYAVAIKLINYYINTKYKLFGALEADFLPKKVTRKKVTQTSMAMVYGE